MAMVVADDSCLQANSQPKSRGLHGLRVDGCLALFCNSSNEPSELSQWPCGHDDSTINIVMGIIIIIIIIIIYNHLGYMQDSNLTSPNLILTP